MSSLSKFYRPALFTLIAVASIQAKALANGYYDGPAVDVNFQATKPARYQQCEKYGQDNNPLNLSAGDYLRRYKACDFGLDEADRMAERFGGGNGKIEGFLQGFAWGLNKMERASENDAEEMKRAAQAVDGMGDTMQKGLEAGRAKGASDGKARGSSDAIDRFVKALNSGALPSNAFAVPQTNYQGEDNGYATNVGAVPTIQSILKNEVNIGQLRVYSSYDSLYLGQLTPPSLWDLWFDNGVRNFEKVSWYDKNRAYETWQQRPIDTKPKFEALNIPPVTYQVTTTTPNPDPTKPPITTVVTKTLNLQDTFKDGFVGSYEWYINYYFSQQFYTWMDEGQRDGEQVGVLAGKRVAFYKGLVDAYDRKYKESSKQTYRDSFVSTYTAEFNRVFQDYATHPVLSLAFDALVGEVNDGIIQPEEGVSAKFSMKNYGGVGSALDVSLMGDVMDATSQSMQMPMLASKSFSSAVLAKIDSRMQPRQTARVTLKVNGLTAELDQLVQRMLEIDNSGSRVDALTGSGDVTVSISNIATVRTPGLVTATLKLNGSAVQTQNLGFLEAGNQRSVTLDFGRLDPMDLIEGRVQAQVVLSMENLVLDTATVPLTIADARLSLARYFSQLMNGEGVVPNTVSRDMRMAEVQSRMVQVNWDETRNHRELGKVWKNDPDSTMIGKIVSQFRGRPESDDAKTRYDALARELYKARVNLPKFLFIKGAKRKAFEALCKELSKTGKL